MYLFYHRTRSQLSGDVVVRVRVRIDQVAMMGERRVYRTGEEFECSEETASSLGNAVTVLADSEQPGPEQSLGRKRR